MAHQQHAQQQRAQFRTQAEMLKTQSADHQRQRQPVQHQQFVMAAPVQQPVHQRPQQRQTQRQQRPRRGRRRAGGRHQGQRRQVLNDQNANRQAPVKCAQLGFFLQHLGRQHRAGKPQRGRQQHRLPRWQGQNREKTQSQRHPTHRQVQQSSAPDFRADQAPQAQLESDAEQQQQHAGMSDLIQQRAAVLTECVQRESSRQIADQRRQSQMPDQ